MLSRTTMKKSIHTKRPKLLIVEDDLLISKSIKTYFAKVNYVVKTVRSAEDARECLKSFAPSAMILDIALPQKNGLEFLKELRNSESWRHMPVIITTNLDAEENIHDAYLLSAAAYIVKSDLSLMDLVSKVTNHINISSYAQKTLS